MGIHFEKLKLSIDGPPSIPPFNSEKPKTESKFLSEGFIVHRASLSGSYLEKCGVNGVMLYTVIYLHIQDLSYQILNTIFGQIEVDFTVKFIVRLKNLTNAIACLVIYQ